MCARKRSRVSRICTNVTRTVCSKIERDSNEGVKFVAAQMPAPKLDSIFVSQGPYPNLTGMVTWAIILNRTDVRLSVQEKRYHCVNWTAGSHRVNKLRDFLRFSRL